VGDIHRRLVIIDFAGVSGWWG